MPARLAALKRIVQSGTPVSSLIEEIPNSLFEFFEIEWKAVDEANSPLMSVLTLLSYDNRKFTVQDIANIFEKNAESIANDLRALSFITSIETINDEVTFISESFRKFAATRLRQYRDQVRATVIDNLLKRPTSSDALAYLPDFFEESGRLQELVEFLSPENFAAMIENSQSLVDVQQKAELGVRASIRLDKDSELLRFGLQRAIIADLDGCQISRAEIKARMSLNDYASALALAQATVLKQDRLQLIALIARLQKEKGLAPEPALLDQVWNLYKNTAPKALRENTVQLASDLMHVRPDLAIQLVEQTPETSTTNNSPDWALARLSVKVASQKRTSNLPKDFEKIRARIKDPAALRFSTAISLLVGNYTPSEVLAEVGKLESRADQLYLFQEWTEHTTEPENAGDIIEHALRLAVQSTEYTPHAAHLRKLAIPLPFLSNEQQRRSLIAVFDTQKATVENISASQDYAKLQLILVHAERIHDKASANRRLLEAYFYISEIKDLELRSICLATLLAALNDIDPNNELTDTKDVGDASERELTTLVNQLLFATGSHELVSRPILEALSASRPGLAFNIASSLNTLPRRESAKFDVFESALKQRLTKVPFGLLESKLDEFEDPDYKEAAVAKALHKLIHADEHSITKCIPAIIPFVKRIETIRDMGLRYGADCDALRILSKTPANLYAAEIAKLEADLLSTWNAMEAGAEKIEAGFAIAGSLASIQRDRASDYLTKADNLRKGLALNYNDQSCLQSIQLAIRSYAGLLPKRFDDASDLDRLVSLIERVASDQARIGLWVSLALRYFQHNRESDGKRIVVDRIIPNLQEVGRRNLDEWKQALTKSAPALYMNHKSSALDLISRIDQEAQDEAYERIITFILRRLPTADAFDAALGDHNSSLSYEDALDICELLERGHSDCQLSHTINCVVDSILWKHRERAFTPQQRAEIVQRLTQIVDKKLPNPRHITHEGFAILSRADILRLKKQKPYPWDALINEARQVPNLSDRCYVLLRLAETCTDADMIQRQNILREAKSFADQIPSMLDRISRWESITIAASEIDLAFCKQCMRQTLRDTLKIEDPEIEDVRQNLVDLAHRIDPDLAGSLGDSLDDDRARKQAREAIERQELKKKMRDGSYEWTADGDQEDIARSFWELLGKLNANRVEALPVGRTRAYVSTASNMPLTESYPVFAWALENAFRRRGGAEESGKLLKGMYSAVLISCELAYRLSGRAASKLRDVVQNAALRAEQASFIVHTGEREAALEFLRQWLSQHASEYVKICDPYFGPGDVGALQLVQRAVPNVSVSILTSKKHQDDERKGLPTEEVYNHEWRSISDSCPPNNEIVVVGTSNGKLPIHERWWLTRKAGLRLGTSFHSIGEKRETEISVLTESEAREREQEVDEYLMFRKREHDGEKLNILVFGVSGTAPGQGK